MGFVVEHDVFFFVELGELGELGVERLDGLRRLDG